MFAEDRIQPILHPNRYSLALVLIKTHLEGGRKLLRALFQGEKWPKQRHELPRPGHRAGWWNVSVTTGIGPGFLPPCSELTLKPLPSSTWIIFSIPWACVPVTHKYRIWVFGFVWFGIDLSKVLIMLGHFISISNMMLNRHLKFNI